MSVNGANSSVGKVDLKEVAKNVGTGPSSLEKEVANKLKEGAKEAIKDVSNFMKTPQAKVITTGVLISPLVLPIGMGMVLGGAALSAFKALDDNKGALKEGAKKGEKVGGELKNASDKVKEGAKEAVKGAGEVNEVKDAAGKGAVAGAVAGTLLAGPLGTVPGAITGAAASAVAEVIKNAIQK